MKRIILVTLIVFSANFLFSENKIGDITNIVGVSSTPVVGYGLVAGLNKTGDYHRSYFTEQTVKNMLEKFGLKTPDRKVRTRNVAAVMVTANIPAFIQTDSKFDITVSSIGDARSLENGTLLPTDLFTMDGCKIAIAQGPVSVGGFSVEVQNIKVGKNYLLTGNISDGGILLSRIPSSIGEDEIVLSLKNPDLNTAVNIAEKINKITDNAASVRSAGAVEVIFPDSMFFTTSKDEQGETIFAVLDPTISLNMKNNYLHEIVNLPITQEINPKIVINEKTGVIVVGEHVTISPVAISYNNINIKISKIDDVIELESSEQADSKKTKSIVEITDEYTKMKEIPRTATVKDIVETLNNLGASPRDLIGIFQALKRAGALQAELIFM